MVLDDFDIDVLKEIERPGSQEHIKYGAALMTSYERLKRLRLVVTKASDDGSHAAALSASGEAVLSWVDFEKQVIKVLEEGGGEDFIDAVKLPIRKRLQLAWKYGEPAPTGLDVFRFSLETGFECSGEHAVADVFQNLDSIYRRHLAWRQSRD